MDDFDFGDWDWGGGSDNNNYNTNYNDYGDYTPQGPVAPQPAPAPSYDYGDYSDYGNNNQPAPQQYGGATDDYGNPMDMSQSNPQGPVQPDSGYYGEGTGGSGDQGMTETAGMPDQGPMGPQMPPGMRSRGMSPQIGMPGQGAAGQQPGQQGPGPAGQKSGGFLDSLGGLLGGGKGGSGGGLGGLLGGAAGGIPDWLLAAGGAGLAAYAIPKLMQMGGPSTPNVQAPARQAGPPIPTFGGAGFGNLSNMPVVGMQMGQPVQSKEATQIGQNMLFPPKQ